MSRTQLLQAGVPAHIVAYRVKRRGLLPLHRGVYRVGPWPAPLEREMAALLATGSTAVLSHRTAAGLWGLLPAAPRAAPVDVSILTGYRAPGRGIRVHRVGAREDDEVATLRGMPVTTAARTILDLAAEAPPGDLERALAQAERRGLCDPGAVADLMVRYPRRAGAAVLRPLLDGATPALTRSRAEERFLALVRKAGLDEPRTNVVVEGHEVDFLWRDRRLVVEVDGRAYHGSASAFERDRARDASLTAAGYRVMRVTWRQLTREPAVLLVRLTRALFA